MRTIKIPLRLGIEVSWDEFVGVYLCLCCSPRMPSSKFKNTKDTIFFNLKIVSEHTEHFLKLLFQSCCSLRCKSIEISCKGGRYSTSTSQSRSYNTGRNIYKFLKGTVSVIPSNPRGKDCNVRFTKVPFKALSDQVWIKYQCL